MPNASAGAVISTNSAMVNTHHAQSQQDTQANATIVKKNYEVLVKFVKFFREKGDQLFEPGTKLTVTSEQMAILDQYLSADKNKLSAKDASKHKDGVESELLKKITNMVYYIQDFFYKITNVKINGAEIVNKNLVNLNLFGSLIYLEIRNCPINNVSGLQNLRSQLEIFVCVNSINKLEDVLHLCGSDRSSPLHWPKLHTLNLSNNQLKCLDNSFRLTPSIHTLDLSNNSLIECGAYLRDLTKLKKLNLSSNKLVSLPEMNEACNELEILDLSNNSIEKLNVTSLKLMEKLVYLNLSNNSISDLKELNNLRCLLELKELIIDNNPISKIKHFKSIIKEIIELNHKDKLSNLSKVSTPRSLEGMKVNQVRMKTTQKNVEVLPKSASKLKFSKRSPAIRCVDIDQLDSDSEQNSDAATTFNSNPPPTMVYSASPVNSDYDSDRLQNELNALKNLRKNYGPQWLISSPNLDAKKINLHSAIDNDKLLIENLKLTMDRDKELSEYALMNTLTIIDSFPVNKIVEDDASMMTFLNINERYLIEKDINNSTVQCFFEFVNLFEMRIKEHELQVLMTFERFEKNLSNIDCAYQFENDDELRSFAECLSRVLLNNINYLKCRLYLCHKCYYIHAKSKLNGSEELSCDICKFTLKEDSSHLDQSKSPENAKDDIDFSFILDPKASIVPKTEPQSMLLKIPEEPKPVQLSRSLPRNKSFTLKEALDSMKPTGEELNIEKIVEEKSTTLDSPKNEENVETAVKQHTDSLISVAVSEAPISEEVKPVVTTLESFLRNNQLEKSEIDKLTKESQKFENNLKLYFMINLLNDESERLISWFRLKIYITNDPDTCLRNCLIVLTNKTIYVFKIRDKKLFEQNMDYEKCIKMEHVIEINRIEIIEISCGQHCLSIAIDDEKIVHKLITFDIYQTQSISGVLLKIINECDCPSLKQTRKKKPQQDTHLLEIFDFLYPLRKGVDCSVELFSFCEKNEGDRDTLKHIFVFNEQSLVLIEEDLNYFQKKPTHKSPKKPYKIIETHKIINIASMRLFRDSETKLVIIFLDEILNNSKQYSLVINVNKPFILSQLITKIKTIWEKIFLIDLPIAF